MGETAKPAVSSSVMVSDAPVTLPVPWSLAIVPVTVNMLSAASTSLSTAVIVAVSAALAVCPAAKTMVAPAPVATV